MGSAPVGHLSPVGWHLNIPLNNHFAGLPTLTFFEQNKSLDKYVVIQNVETLKIANRR